ncbi:MAG: amino acid ABC transporter ATP-binding protein [Lachnospiraceae bacterium]|nr:amino acid ABC transporter ATP-binding protein [Lachnospiraceae bacterium]
MIKVDHLSKKFGNNVVLSDISFDIEKGDVIAIIGPSGTGKSTLLRSLDLLERPENGKISFDDETYELAHLKGKNLRSLTRRTAMVFQSFNLFSRKTALENVMEALLLVKKLDKSAARVKAEEALTKVGLQDKLDYYPKHLSGGQQQRVAIARALALEPELIYMDEPTSALDPELVGEVLDTIRQIAKEGNTLLLVSHEMSFVRKVATKIIFLEGGKIVEQGRPEQIFEAPKNERTKQFLMRNNILFDPEYSI